MKETFLYYSSMPDNFKSEIDVVACYLEFRDTFLLLRRHPNSNQGNRWCLPGGKIEAAESSKDGIIREVHEEVGLKLTPSNTLELGRLYIKRHDAEFTMHIFSFSYTSLPQIKLNLKEHTEAKWVTYEEAKTLPLILGGLKTLDHLICLKALKSQKMQ